MALLLLKVIHEVVEYRMSTIHLRLPQDPPQAAPGSGPFHSRSCAPLVIGLPKLVAGHSATHRTIKVGKGLERGVGEEGHLSVLSGSSHDV